MTTPGSQLSALQIASQYISMSQDEVAAANRIINFDGIAPLSLKSTNMGLEGMGIENPHFNFHDPRGKPFLKREGGQTDLILAHMLLQS